ncbi:hypothetical protein N1851_031109 [Merluccius polli]|uniref:Alkylated DNA repair protein AlkB homologue 8 N-terminal domain-containing protein n=1 Tax=Merluccius polli TaxID=89951 RepID=A0AA47NQ84_MERPO|nr:hypothetical protein N1851_031109 [Merluccius polli]
MIMDYRKQQGGGHAPIHIETDVERAASNSSDLTWTQHTGIIIKTARQRLFFLRRLKKFGMAPQILTNVCLAASLSGVVAAPPSTERLFRGWSKLPNTSQAGIYQLCRIPTPESEEGPEDQGPQPQTVLSTPIAASSPTLIDSQTAFTSKQ